MNYAIALDSVRTVVRCQADEVSIVLRMKDSYLAEVAYDDIVSRTRAGETVIIELKSNAG